MPKIVTEKDKEIARDLIRQKTEGLIKQIGLKNITVTNICQEVPIGKGTFYYYYESKELLLYEIIKQKEQKLTKQILQYAKYPITAEEKIIKALSEAYIGEDSIVNMVNPEEVQQLMKALPPEHIRSKDARGEDFFVSSIKLLGVDPAKCSMGVTGELLDCVHLLAARKSKFGEEVKQEALQIMIKTIATYMVSN